MDYPIIPYPAMAHAFDAQPPGARRIDMIVLHATAGTRQGDLYTLSGRDRRHLVSCHYYITKLGEIYQLVQDKDIAWHAGVSYWQGESSCNRFSLGIELENLNDGNDKYPQPQMDAALWLMQTKVRQYAIPRSRFVRHLDVAPRRKVDPRGFPWESFKSEVYRNIPDEPPAPPQPQVPPEVELRDALIDYSYTRVNHLYIPDWNMHQFALKYRLGPPVASPFRFTAEGRVWQAEIYGTDVLCAPSGHWGAIVRLSQLQDGELKTTLRGEAYRQLGTQYHEDWPMHQFADRNDLGIPLSENIRVNTSDGRAFMAQIFQAEILFSPAARWTTVLPLSALLDAPALDPFDMELRDILLNQQYVRIGNRFHPDWELHKAALRLRVGAPLSDQVPFKFGEQDYMVASYARDVLFAPTGDWALVRRLSDML